MALYVIGGIFRDAEFVIGRFSKTRMELLQPTGDPWKQYVNTLATVQIKFVMSNITGQFCELGFYRLSKKMTTKK